MTPIPPVVRFVLALVGASLVVWGARDVALNVPGMQTVSLFELSRAATWTLIVASVLVVVFVGLRSTPVLSSPYVSWLRTPSLAWLMWVIAIGAFGYMAWVQGYSFYKMVLDYQENAPAAREMGMTLPDPMENLRKSEVKPALIAVVAGLVIQFVGVCLRGRELKAGKEAAGAGSGAARSLPERLALNFLTLLASVTLAVAFFLPWLFVFVEDNEVGIAGNQLSQHFQGPQVQAAWLVLAAGVVLAVLHFIRPMRAVHVLVGLAPLLALAWYCREVGGGLIKDLGAGVWTALAAGFLLVFTPVRGEGGK